MKSSFRKRRLWQLWKVKSRLPKLCDPIDTPEKKDLVDQFRKHPDVISHLKEEYNDDYLSRWLRARNWDLEKAASMFNLSMIWRKENDIDTIVERYEGSDSFKRMISYWPCSYNELFYTKEGWPVYYERVGIIDPKYLLEIVSAEDLLQFHIFEAEKRERLRFELFKKHGFSVGTIFIHV
jgi:hypothetical protein